MISFDGPTTLLRFINIANEDSIYQSLAVELLKRKTQISNATITDMADACFVSTATLSRFCKKLGFKEYAQFKESFRSEYEFERDYTPAFREQLQHDTVTAIRSLGDQICTSVTQCAQQLDFQTLDRIIHRIHESEHVAFFSSNLLQQIATDIQQRLEKLGKLTYSFYQSTYQLQHVQTMDQHSLAIFISVNGKTLLAFSELIRELKKRQVPMILITQNPSTVLDNLTDCTLLLGGHNQNDTGRFCIMYFMEALLLRYYQLYGRV